MLAWESTRPPTRVGAQILHPATQSACWSRAHSGAARPALPSPQRQTIPLIQPCSGPTCMPIHLPAHPPTHPYTSALLRISGSMAGSMPNASSVGRCQASARTSIKLVREALLTSVTWIPPPWAPPACSIAQHGMDGHRSVRKGGARAGAQSVRELRLLQGGARCTASLATPCAQAALVMADTQPKHAPSPSPRPASKSQATPPIFPHAIDPLDPGRPPTHP